MAAHSLYVLILIMLALIVLAAAVGGSCGWGRVRTLLLTQARRAAASPFGSAVYINLDRNRKRRKHFEQSYNALSLETIFSGLRRFAAVDGSRIDIPAYWHLVHHLHH